MPLTDIYLELADTALPADVRSFLREAQVRIDRFQLAGHVPAFVPSDYETAYRVLQALVAADLPAGNLFCEWGSGYGVVACLAAMLDFDACGIEIEGQLVDAAQQLADDFDLPAKFVHGSFIPRGGTACIDDRDSFAWLATEESCLLDELELAPDDLDVIFAYPWPDEELVTSSIFERFAAVGAVLVTYHGGQDFRQRRKSRPGRPPSRKMRS
jgi:hypothetical protein